MLDKMEEDHAARYLQAAIDEAERMPPVKSGDELPDDNMNVALLPAVAHAQGGIGAIVEQHTGEFVKRSLRQNILLLVHSPARRSRSSGAEHKISNRRLPPFSERLENGAQACGRILLRDTLGDGVAEYR